jgi:hypothetical protein
LRAGAARAVTMSEDEPFLNRWSRRKQALKEQAAKPAPAAAVPEAPTSDPKAATPAPPPEPVDLTKLPPIDSLTADSDYTAFLRPGVPQSMQIAALRRLWLTDPSVKNYEALVDYAWDFNAPGYGKLLPTDDVEKLLKAVFGPSQTESGQEDASPPRVSEPPKIAVQNDTVRRSEGDRSRPASMPSSDTAALAPAPAAAVEEADRPTTARRRHGAALPQGSEDPHEG